MDLVLVKLGKEIVWITFRFYAESLQQESLTLYHGSIIVELLNLFVIILNQNHNVRQVVCLFCPITFFPSLLKPSSLFYKNRFEQNDVHFFTYGIYNTEVSFSKILTFKDTIGICSIFEVLFYSKVVYNIHETKILLPQPTSTNAILRL